MESVEQLSITVLGAGPVGSALARPLVRAGHEVTIGVRNPAGAGVTALLAELGPPSSAEVARVAVAGADVVVCAVPGAAMPGLVDECAELLAGRIVIDATNDLTEGHASGRLSALPHLIERVPSALGYRAFNSVGWENLAAPVFGGVRADLFYAGPDGLARRAVERIIADVGFRPQYVGAGDDAHLAVDTLTTLWFALAFGRGRGRHLALRLLADEPEADRAPVG